MPKKFQYNPITGGYGLLNKSYNRIKSSGNRILTEFRSYLEDDDIQVIMSVYEPKFESFVVEIFDLRFLVRLEIELVPEFNTFTKGKIVTYYMTPEGRLLATGIEYRYDEEGRIYAKNNEGLIPDFTERSSFVLDFISYLIIHILNNKYTAIPNSTYEGENENLRLISQSLGR